MLGTFAAVAQADAPPAGGSEIGEILIGGAAASVALVAVVAIGIAHRRRGFLNPLVQLSERKTGLPAWSTIPVWIAGASLVVAVWGYYWDVSWHIDQGRDDGALANPAHWFILIGLDGIAFAALLAMFLGDDRSPSAVRITDRWHVPAGAILLGACGVVALAGFPLDDIWHRLFGQDVTAWGPTHIQMIGGASLATLGCWALLVEGRRSVAQPLPKLGQRLVRTSDIALAGAFLIGLSTLQVEFDFGVPQFRQTEHAVLLALGAGIGLVAARVRLGRGGALMAVAFFLAARAGLALGVSSFERVVPHFPLYVVEALIVEAVALAVPRNRQLTLGLIAGLGIGTVGFGAEWAWTHIWMPLPWSTDQLPEMAVLAVVAGIAGGLLGAMAGRAVSEVADSDRQPTPRGAAVLAWAGSVAAIGIALPMTANRDWQADLRVDPVAGERDVAFVEVGLDGDAAAAAADATWFHVLSWQGAGDGGPGGSSITEFVRQPDGSWRTAEPVPIGGSAKTMLRLHSGASMQSVPIFLPDDPAIPAEGVDAEASTRTFQADKRVLQREARTDNVGLERIAYVLLAALAAVWMAVISWGLRRIEHPGKGRPGPSLAPWTSSSGSRLAQPQPS